MRLLIVDDHTMVRVCLRHMLEQVFDGKEIGEAKNGEDALRLIREQSPQTVLVDMNLSEGISGLEVIKRGLRHNPDLRFIVLTASCNLSVAQQALEAGALGYLHKDVDLDELVRAIQAVNCGSHHIAKRIATHLALNHTSKGNGSPFDKLSQRELETLLLIAKGLKVKEIADALHISGKTVNGYRYRMQEKLGIDNDVRMVTLAIRYGVFDVKEFDPA